ncbi:MAG: phospholipase D-like domain-containing protein [Desulfobulbaceae bacterium]|nr:phospholipase D-like domain-containing protein [Desulfobulbaceae bacterium]
MNNIYLSGTDRTQIGSRLNTLIAANRPQAIGMATAFLSISGAQTYDSLLEKNRTKVSRVVAGLSGAITHPGAIEYLLKKGHNIRLGEFVGGIFHPKLLVGGDRFLKSGQLSTAICGYVGSANFTAAGMGRNLEVMLETKDPEVARGIADAFRIIWAEAKPITKAAFHAYERAFAHAQLNRTVTDLEFLNVIDPIRKSAKRPPLIPPNLSSAVWAGLQSFTGEHAF